MGVQKLKQALNLQPHPEGGFYAETFRDDSVKLLTSSLPPHFKVGRPVSTAIYFLLPTGSKSRMHLIPSAEVWHFYSGEPLTNMWMLFECRYWRWIRMVL
jgi:predicted cupin superfamily sugar epimerase